MERLFDHQFYVEQLAAARAWIAANAVALSVATIAQILIIGLAYLAARIAAPRLRRLFTGLSRGRFEPQVARIGRALSPLTLPIIWLTLLWLAVLIEAGAGLPFQLMKPVVSLLTAWVIIRFVSALVRDPVWSRLVAIVVWVIAALSILGLLAPTMTVMDSIALEIGGLRISVLTVVKAVLSLGLLLWIATLAGRVLERRVTAATNLTPSLKVLITNLLKIVLTLMAIVIALRVVGIDLTAFAVLTGAIGVGIGFGLQKMVSNFVSGITILLDKSIKPGDVLVVGDSYGRVQSLGARYASLITRDGIEFLIPNEELVTQQVINWSYSSDQVRLKVPIGVAYDADVRQAIALCVEAAAKVERVLKHPAPVCLLKGFGDNAVDLELRFWIHDPMNGVSNVKSEVLLHIWDSFHANKIAFPYPQRDVHITTPVEVRVRSGDGAGGPGEAP
ncbi:MAG TPA: mechanosensitive ion channel domain-containing protein [Dongiaceae bacterium]|jgi:small-conductance mechanosensitive channel|nr:mechanosensitive ion channel domain-containing protein [Dongiaceae bacterium]